jgi:large subunit ribosomal protein L21
MIKSSGQGAKGSFGNRSARARKRSARKALPPAFRRVYNGRDREMYAIVETGGKQYRVANGDVVRVEKLPVTEGDTVTFDTIVALSNDNGEMVFGTPYVDGAKVTAKVMKQGKEKKIMVFHYKQKVNRRKRYGHRQPFTSVQIESIQG